MASTHSTSAKKSLHCFHCKRDGFKRSELTGAEHPAGKFLCTECRDLPDVKGLRDSDWVAHRGLHQNWGQGYWEETRRQLHVVTDDNPEGLSEDELAERANVKALAARVVRDDPESDAPPTPAPQLTSFPPAGSAHTPQRPTGRRAPRERAATETTEFATWHADMLSDGELKDADKLYLVGLARYADHAIGSNCFPRYEEQASALGWSRKRIRGALASVVAKGWVRTHQMVTSRGRTTYLYQFLRPATAKHGAWEGPVEYSNRKGARLTAHAGP